MKKDKKNPLYNSKYVSLDTIQELYNPILSDMAIVVFHYTQDDKVVTRLYDTEDDTFLISSFPLVQDNNPQKLGSCITYAKRYNLAQLLNIITDEDDDGNKSTEVVERFDKSDFDLIVQNKDKYTNGEELLKKIKEKKSISKVWKEKILDLYK